MNDRTSHGTDADEPVTSRQWNVRGLWAWPLGAAAIGAFETAYNLLCLARLVQ